MEEHSTKKAQIIQLNESAVRDHLGEMVRNTVEETLNGMLDAEADRLCNARSISETTLEPIRGQVTTNASSTQRPGK